MGIFTKKRVPTNSAPSRHFIPQQTTPGEYYRWLVRPRWRGPLYFRLSSRMADLQSVIFLIACMVKVNAPLPQGLEVAAVDAVRKVRLRENNPIFRTILIAGILPLVGIAIIASLYELYLFNDVALALVFIVSLIPVPFLVALFILPKTRKQAVLLHMRDRLNSGCQLSEVMQEMNRFFPSMHTDLIRTAENTGRMEECIDYVQKYIANQFEARRQIRRIFNFFAVYLLLITVIINFLMIKVIPVFVELLREFSGDQHQTFWELELFISTVDFIHYKYPVIIVATFALLAFCHIAIRINEKTGLLSCMFLFIPVLRRYIIDGNIIAIGTHLEMLLLNETPLPQALQKVSASHINYFYKQALRNVSVNVENGENLADALSRHRSLFPAAFIDQIRLGIYTSKLAESMNQINEHYQTAQRIRLKIFLDILQPVATLFLALIVGAFMHCVFRCFTSISDSLVMW